MGDAGNFWKMKRGGAAERCAAKGVGGWIGVKGMRLEARRGRGLPRIISFNYSKMSGWITSYFFLELTFNGLSALTATTDSFYILLLREGERERGEKENALTSSSTSSLVFGRPIKIDRGRVLDGRDDNLSSPEPRTILRNRGGRAKAVARRNWPFVKLITQCSPKCGFSLPLLPSSPMSPALIPGTIFAH